MLENQKLGFSFKPYYNWNTFNTKENDFCCYLLECFKPYYNWNTFNTEIQGLYADLQIQVLNLIITGIPSIPEDLDKLNQNEMVLNLIITGMPSIRT